MRRCATWPRAPRSWCWRARSTARAPAATGGGRGPGPRGVRGVGGRGSGPGSSRDGAAKGPALQGIRVVIAESYERIHRSNLVGMGILPLQFAEGESAASLGLEGTATFAVSGLSASVASGFAQGRDLTIRAVRPDGKETAFQATIRIDTPQEILYY